ncbi:hypothetical protein RN053_12000 [Pantoea dispersa]|uniref:hypothetical protein n=1 Tax=Pantoea dispersa TaxID=59814 RepID=UPI0028DFD16C|nr:hypothetical protein [Pantoea dispersa]MDT8851214.1 hypothetical protein [Pantoea dispersa]
MRILGLTWLEVQVLNGALILTAKEEAAFIAAVSTPQKRTWRNGKVEWRAA